MPPGHSTRAPNDPLGQGVFGQHIFADDLRRARAADTIRVWSIPSWPPGPAGSAAARRTRCCVAGDGARVLFLRSAGPYDPADALWVAGRRRPARNGWSPTRPRASTTRRRRAASRSYAARRGRPGRRVRVRRAAATGADLVHGDVVDGARPPATGRSTRGPTRPGGASPTSAGGALRVRRAGRRRRAAGRRGGRRHLGPGRAASRPRTSAVPAATGGRRTAARSSPPGSTTPASRAGTCTTRPGPTQPPATLAYPRAGAAERRGHAAPARPRRRLGRRALGPRDLPVPGRGRAGPSGGPLITVLRRLQQHGLVLAVDPRTGETQVHAELADPRWVEPVAGTPCHLPDGRVLVGGELAHDGYDARCLFADGTPAHPAVALRAPGRRADARPGRLAGPAGRGERGRAERAAPLPGRAPRSAAAASRSRRLTTAPGWHIGARRRRHAGRRRAVARPRGCRLDRVRSGDRRWAELRSLAAHAAVRAPARAGPGHRPAAAGRRCSTRAATSPAAGCRCCSTSTAARATRRCVATRGRVAGAAVVGRRRLRRGRRRQPGYARRGARRSRRWSTAASPT